MFSLAENEGVYIIEMHYRFFDDRIHSIDAIIHNRCEQKLLGIIKDAARICGVKVSIEAEPVLDGSQRRRYRIRPQSQPANAGNTQTAGTSLNSLLIVALATAIFMTMGNIGTEMAKKAINADPVIDSLENTHLELQNKNLEADLEIKLNQLHETPAAHKKKAAYYKILQKDKQVKSSSVQVIGNQNTVIMQPITINSNQFLALETDSVVRERYLQLYNSKVRELDSLKSMMDAEMKKTNKGNLLPPGSISNI